MDVQLTAAEVQRYEDDGYLIVRQVLSDRHLDPIRRVMERTVERQANEWYAQGMIEDRCQGKPFERRYGALRAQLPPTFSKGCMQVIPGSHRNGLRPDIRVQRNNLLGLAESELAGLHPVSCIMKPGDVLLFSELIYHRSVDNVSDRTRWSLDVRYYFDAANTRLSAKETERYRGSGYYCYSGAAPRA